MGDFTALTALSAHAIVNSLKPAGGLEKSEVKSSMEKPYLFIVTGRPGAGKSTFAREFARAAFLPLISRDELKEGYVHTQGRPHNELPPASNRVATDLFFEAIELLLKRGVSLAAEAAFQHPLWSARLEPLLDKARLYVLICSPGSDRKALERFLQRGLTDPRREYFHGDKGVAMVRRGETPAVSPYEEPRLGVPTYHIDTSQDYKPSIEQLLRLIWGAETGAFLTGAVPQN